METIFSLKILGSYRVYLYAKPERFDTMIICESMRIRHELNTNWYDTVRCDKMQHDGDTMQYEAVRWWWRINTFALWCDENTIGTNRNLHQPMRTCAIQYDNAIVAHRIATYWVAADMRRIPVRMFNESIRMYNDEIRTNRNWHESIRRLAMQYDAIRIGFASQGQYECQFVLVRRQNSRQWDEGIRMPWWTQKNCSVLSLTLPNFLLNANSSHPHLLPRVPERCTLPHIVLGWSQSPGCYGESGIPADFGYGPHWQIDPNDVCGTKDRDQIYCQDYIFLRNGHLEEFHWIILPYGVIDFQSSLV